MDSVEAALSQARERCAGCPAYEFARMERAAPAAGSGRSICSCYPRWSTTGASRDLELMAAFAGRAVEPGGDIVLVHWTGETDYPLTGDEAAQRFIAATAPFTRIVLQDRAELYRIDVLRRLGQRPSALVAPSAGAPRAAIWPGSCRGDERMIGENRAGLLDRRPGRAEMAHGHGAARLLIG